MAVMRRLIAAKTEADSDFSELLRKNELTVDTATTVIADVGTALSAATDDDDGAIARAEAAAVASFGGCVAAEAKGEYLLAHEAAHRTWFDALDAAIAPVLVRRGVTTEGFVELVRRLELGEGRAASDEERLVVDFALWAADFEAWAEHMCSRARADTR